MDIEQYTIEELIGLRDTIDSVISNYEDGYTYICDVRSYGRNWRDKSIKNIHTLQGLCHEYYGEDGIVDVYSTNPNLKVDNYGKTMYVVSEEEYNKWKGHQDLLYIVERIEEELSEWENRENVPFYQRPTFMPGYGVEDLNEYKNQLSEYDTNYISPISYNVEG